MKVNEWKKTAEDTGSCIGGGSKPPPYNPILGVAINYNLPDGKL